MPDVLTVAVTRVDGGVTVLRVVVNEYGPDPEKPGERMLTREYPVDEAYIDRLIARYGWTGPLTPTGWYLVPNDYVDESTDRTFRAAWKHETGQRKPVVDMPKAREIHRGRLRRMRTPLLDDLDTAYMRADEVGDQQEKKRIASKKQALRDVTDDPAIEAAQTPDELKAVIPEVLRG